MVLTVSVALEPMSKLPLKTISRLAELFWRVLPPLLPAESVNMFAALVNVTTESCPKEFVKFMVPPL